MVWIKKILLYVTLLVMLSACGETIMAGTNQQVSSQESKSLEYRLSEVIETERIIEPIESYEEFVRITLYFDVPVDFSREETQAHAELCLEKIISEYDFVWEIAVKYHDTIIPRKYSDCEVASMSWYPGFAANPDQSDAIHHTTFIFYPYDISYELSDSEQRVCFAMQDLALEKEGRLLDLNTSNLTENSSEYPCYQQIAEEYDMSIDELLIIRNKAIMRREPIIISLSET